MYLAAVFLADTPLIGLSHETWPEEINYPKIPSADNLPGFSQQDQEKIVNARLYRLY